MTSFEMKGRWVRVPLSRFTCNLADDMGDHTVLEFDPPIPLKAISTKEKKLSDGVTFEPSENPTAAFASLSVATFLCKVKNSFNRS